MKDTIIDSYKHLCNILQNEDNYFINEIFKEKYPDSFYKIQYSDGEIFKIKITSISYQHTNEHLLGLNKKEKFIKKIHVDLLQKELLIKRTKFDIFLKGVDSCGQSIIFFPFRSHDEYITLDIHKANITSKKIKNRIKRVNNILSKVKEHNESYLKRENYSYLGYSNSWTSENLPDKYNKCKSKKHTVWVNFNNGRCLTISVCPICKIYYRTDSSD